MDRVTICDVCPEEVRVPLSFNPELVEIGNQSGAVFGSRYCLVAITDTGKRFHHREYLDMGEAHALVRRVTAHGSINPELWDQGDSVYGSPSWEAEDNCRAMAHAVSPMARTIRDW
jgi:hypothetical protein